MDIFKKLNYILDKKQKINIVVLAVMIFIGGILETLSISAMLPVVWVIIDAESVQQNKYCQWIMELLHIQNMQGFIIMLLVALMIMYILKNAYLLLLTSEQNRFISVNRNRLISQVLREFLNRPYEFYLDADIPTVFRLTDSDIPNVFGILMAIISLASEVVVFVLICGVLIVTDWKLVLVLIFISGIVTLVLFKVLKPKLNSLGMTNQAIQSRIAKWRIQAIYGIKDVKVLHRESFFADNYESNGKIGAKLNQKYAIINALPRILIETIFMVSILGYLVVCVALGDDMTQMLPTLTAFGLAAVRLLPCVNRINTYLTDISYFRPCLDYVYENMNINEISKKTNHAGGILGGISDGSDIILRAYFKPTPSIYQKQQTVNQAGEEIEIQIKGRHDPIVVSRAVVVVEAMTAVTILDELLRNMTSRLDGIKKFYHK